MAIHNSCPGLNVQVIVGGQPLTEYIDQDVSQNPHSVTAYVEAVSGAQFEINSTFTVPFPLADVSCAIYLDGKRVKLFWTSKDNIL
jgi:hypothetical protein